MKFPFHLDFSNSFESVGLIIKNNATLSDSRLAVRQIVYLDNVKVTMRIVFVVNNDNLITQATPHFDSITTTIHSSVKNYEQFNKKLEKVIKQGCKLLNTSLK